MPPWQANASLHKSEVDGDCERVATCRQSGSEDRRKSSRLDTLLGRRLIRQAPQLFELLACNGGVKGQGPLRSLGGTRGPFSHVREWSPFPCSASGAAIPLSAARRDFLSVSEKHLLPLRAVLAEERMKRRVHGAAAGVAVNAHVRNALVKADVRRAVAGSGVVGRGQRLGRL